MKKNILNKIIHCVFVYMLIASVQVNAQTVIRRDVSGMRYLELNDDSYELDENVVTVKLKEDAATFSDASIIRTNKLGYSDILVPDSVDIEDFVDMLEANEDVISVEYNSLGVYTSNDPFYSYQWYLQNLNIESTWQILRRKDIVVGVLDSGLDYTHEDICNNNIYRKCIYTNDDEIPDNGIDDDGNGFIDDIYGWNFGDNTNEVKTSNYHGTFVSGILVAKTDNNTGIAGIAGKIDEKGALVLPVCIGANKPITSIVDDAIIYAVDNGVRIIQMSFSCARNNAIDDAIDYAVSKGVLLVCAAGNSSSLTYHKVSYPASNQNVMAVGAIDINNNRADFSRYDQFLEIVAPGKNIYSTSLNNQYCYSNGTSFAAPMVSATAALMLSVNPFLTHEDVRHIMDTTCIKLPDYSFGVDDEHLYGTWNEEVGYGSVNTFAAVSVAEDLQPKVKITNRWYEPVYPYVYHVNLEFTNGELPSEYDVRWNIYCDNIQEWSVEKQNDGSYELLVTAKPYYDIPNFLLYVFVFDKNDPNMFPVLRTETNIPRRGWPYFTKSGVVDNIIEILNGPDNTFGQNKENILFGGRTVTMNLYTLQRQNILSKSININASSTLIDVSCVPNGTYILQIIDKDEVLLKEVIIVRH